MSHIYNDVVRYRNILNREQGPNMFVCLILMIFMLVKGLSALRITIHILTGIYNRNQQFKRKFR